MKHVLRSVVLFGLLAASVQADQITDQAAKDWADKQKQTRLELIKAKEREIAEIRASISKLSKEKLADVKQDMQDEQRASEAAEHHARDRDTVSIHQAGETQPREQAGEKIAASDPKPPQRAVGPNTVVASGMSEADVDQIEADRGWIKKNLGSEGDVEQFEYLSGQVWSSGYQDKDVCWFKDGKVVKVRLFQRFDQMTLPSKH